MATLLLALHAVRAAAVAAYGENRPDLAIRLWPGHPTPALALSLGEIGTAARRGGGPSQAVFTAVEKSARRAPLRIEPLLVSAADRIARGNAQAGEVLLKAAVRRNARAPAARFLLADLYVRQNRIGEAMVELAALDRRLGDVSTAFAPAVAQFLAQPGAVSMVAPVLGNNPPLRAAVLTNLAARPIMTPQLLALTRRGDADEPWLAKSVEQLLVADQIDSARQLWRKASGARADPLLAEWNAPAKAGPFRWRLGGSDAGLAEPGQNGTLRLVTYGRSEAPLADHLLLLAPGTYRLGQTLAGSAPAGTFEWRVTCLQGGRLLASLPVPVGAGQAQFDIPAGCRSQRLALVGKIGDFPRTLNAELSRPLLQRLEGR